MGLLQALRGGAPRCLAAPLFTTARRQITQTTRLVPDKILDIKYGLNVRFNREHPKPTPLGKVYDLGEAKKVSAFWQNLIKTSGGELHRYSFLKPDQQEELFQAIRQSEEPVKSILLPEPLNKKFIEQILKWTANTYQGNLLLLNIVHVVTIEFNRIESYNLAGRALDSNHLEQFKTDLQGKVDAIFLHNIKLEEKAIELLSNLFEQNQVWLRGLAIVSPESELRDMI